MHLPTAASDQIDDVPARLIASAIELYGQQGTQAVSAREVQRHAGVLNEAAIRYYFRNKLGLVSACLAEVNQQLHPIIRDAWAELDELKVDGSCRVVDVVAAFVTAFNTLMLSNPGGVQLVARMIREEGDAGQELLIEHFGSVIWRFEDELRELLPDKSPQALRLHLFLAINSTVNGLVDQSLLWRLPAVDGGRQHFELDPQDLARGFIEYVAAGISGASKV